jgi:cbb3-type cytochrome oxidase maturation protein
MNVLLMLVPISLLLLGCAVGAFFWAVRRDQFEGLDSAAIDILADDPLERPYRDAANADADPDAAD